jgi:hypothetical protein
MRFIYYSDWDGSTAICPVCGRADSLTPTVCGGDDGIELGVVWFRCACGKKFKLGGIYKRVKVET